MAFDPQVAIGAYPAIGIEGQTSRRQPGGPLASRAEQAGSVVVAVVVGDGDIGLSQHVLDGWIQLSPALLQLELALWPATAQGQDHFQAGSSRSDHPQWIGIAWVFAFEKGKRGFQRFDGDPCGARSAHRSHIQAEPIEVECRAVAKVQKVLLLDSIR